MASPCDVLDDETLDAFGGATLQLDPMSGEPSRSVSPNVAGDLIAGSQQAVHFSLRPTSLPGSTRPILKSAFSEPINLLSPPFTPPTPEDVGLGFYTAEGLSRSFYQQPPIGRNRRYSWHCSAPPPPPHPELQFFSVRVGAVSRAVQQCRSLTDPLLDGNIRGRWLLTQINHWDLELERLVLLCDFSMLVFKYDFIALKPLHFTRVELRGLTKAVLGELVYPQHSLVPVISGLAEGVASMLRSVLFPRLHSTIRTIAAAGATAVTKTADTIATTVGAAATGTAGVGATNDDTKNGTSDSAGEREVNGTEREKYDAGKVPPFKVEILSIDSKVSTHKQLDKNQRISESKNTDKRKESEIDRSVDNITSPTTSKESGNSPQSALGSLCKESESGIQKTSNSEKKVLFKELPQEESEKEAASGQSNSEDERESSSSKGGLFTAALSDVSFEPRSRNLPGLRLYNKNACNAATTSNTTATATSTVTSAAARLLGNNTIPQPKDPATSSSSSGSSPRKSPKKTPTNEGRADGDDDVSKNKSKKKCSLTASSYDEGEGVSWKQKWNPFCSSIPYHTLTSHPLYWYTAGEDAASYDVVDLSRQLALALADLSRRSDTAIVCTLRVSRIFRQLVDEDKNSDKEDNDVFLDSSAAKNGGVGRDVFLDTKAAKKGGGDVSLDTSARNGGSGEGKRSGRSLSVNDGSSDTAVGKVEGNGEKDDTSIIGRGKVVGYKLNVSAEGDGVSTRRPVHFKGGYGKILMAGDEEEDQEDEDEFKLVVENYFGLVSLLHNATHLGYFKMRGKISF